MKEDGQQHGAHHAVDPLRDRLGEIAGPRHDRTGEKRAEQRMDAEQLRHERRSQRHHRGRADDLGPDGRGAPRVPLLEEPVAEGCQHERVQRRAPQREPELLQRVSGARHRHDRRQQAPGRHVVDRCARRGDRPEARSSEIPLRQDARKDGKRRDAHRGADEQDERCACHVRLRHPWMNPPGEQRTERERHDDADLADDHRGSQPSAEHREVEAQADDEHEQDDPELAERVHRHEPVRREQPAEHTGRGDAEQRRAERDAGEHLANDARLTDPAGDPACDPRARENDEQLRQEEREIQQVASRQALAGVRR
jgi:hypothetical protein